MEKIFIKTNFIKLGQLIKYLNLISSGSDAKEFLTNNVVIINGLKENRRGRKIYSNDKIEIFNIVYIVQEKVG